MVSEEQLARADITIIDERTCLSGSIMDYNILVDLHIDAVINLKSEQHDDVWELTRRGIAYYWIPVVDWGAPRNDQIAVALELARAYPRVLIHCTQGRGRSATIVAAILLENNPTWTYENAWNFITAKRDKVTPTNIQRQKLVSYFPGR